MVLCSIDNHRQAQCLLRARGGPAQNPGDRDNIARAISEIPVAVVDLSVSKTQALFILTRNESLLAPFYRQLQNPDEKKQARGVVAFRFLKLNQAPDELSGMINDPAQEVRSCVALVLGETGDIKTIPILLNAALDKTQDTGTRSNAIQSLGPMRAKEIETELGKLLKDDAVKVNAAIALSQITGIRHPLVPNGYRLD